MVLPGSGNADLFTRCMQGIVRVLESADVEPLVQLDSMLASCDVVVCYLSSLCVFAVPMWRACTPSKA